jgi:hypothetical protein
MPFGNPQRKTHIVLMNENPSKDFLNVFIKHKFCEKQKRIHFKITFENKVQL